MRMPSVVAAAGSLTLCQQAQDQLQDAISSVTKAEQQLRENTREVRAELQSCVSRQQEALRCREVWLLDQIELLEQLKTETLQQQLHQLHWLRGQFDVISHQLQSSNCSNDLNNQLTCCMEKLSSLSLTPEETPDVRFHADTRSLRQAITSFGRITAQFVEGVSSQNPAHQTAQVQSCPIAAKKQRMETGALGDWLLGARPTSGPATGYQSSKNPEDWLLSQQESQTSCPVLASVDFLQAWGQLRELEAWLLKDQAPVSRERTSSSCSSSFSIEKIDELEFTISPEEEELSDWLITPPTAAMETMSDAERWQRVLKPFGDSWSSSDWLLESGRPPADCSSCCQTTKAVEIENLGQLKCLKTTPSPTSPTSPAPSQALEAWLQQVVPVQQTCRANEVCSSYTDCVCEENCGTNALSLWLLRQDGRDKNGVQVAPPTAKNTPPTLHHREQEQKVQAILEAWLHPSKTSSSSSSSCSTPLQMLTSSLSGWVAPDEEKASQENHSSHFKPSSLFQHPLVPERWVLPGQMFPPAQGARGQPCPPAEEDKWLLRKRSQAQERLALPTVCDLFSCMRVGGDKEKWLHRTAEQM